MKRKLSHIFFPSCNWGMNRLKDRTELKFYFPKLYFCPTKFVITNKIPELSCVSLAGLLVNSRKCKKICTKKTFSIEDFFSKCKEILNGKLHFLCKEKNLMIALQSPFFQKDYGCSFVTKLS